MIKVISKEKCANTLSSSRESLSWSTAGAEADFSSSCFWCYRLNNRTSGLRGAEWRECTSMSVVWRQRFRKILASSMMPSEGSLPTQLHSQQANVSLLRVSEIQKLSLAYHQTSSAWHRYRFIIRDGTNPDVATSRRDRAYLIKLLFFRLLSNETTLLTLFSEIQKFHKRIGSDSPCPTFRALRRYCHSKPVSILQIFDVWTLQQNGNNPWNKDDSSLPSWEAFTWEPQLRPILPLFQIATLSESDFLTLVRRLRVKRC